MIISSVAQGTVTEPLGVDVPPLVVVIRICVPSCEYTAVRLVSRKSSIMAGFSSEIMLPFLSAQPLKWKQLWVVVALIETISRAPALAKKVLPAISGAAVRDTVYSKSG